MAFGYECLFTGENTQYIAKNGYKMDLNSSIPKKSIKLFENT